MPWNNHVIVAVDIIIVIVGDVTIYKGKKLGSGMFGFVFEGKYQGKSCAVKVLYEVGMELIMDLSSTPSERKVQESRLDSFKKERKSLLDLQHPNIVKLFHVCTYPGPQTDLPCLVMELLDCSLRSHLAQNSGYLSLEIQISLSCDVGKALDCLHKAKVIHRDLCGDNVLIQKGGAVPMIAKIADFGMSHIIDPDKMTHSFTVLGHRNGYLPKEGPSQDYDLSLDIHMFGVIMIQIVQAVPEINSQEVRYELLDKISETHPLKKIIKPCVAIAKDDRPTAEAVSGQLKLLLETQIKA